MDNDIFYSDDTKSEQLTSFNDLIHENNNVLLELFGQYN